MGSGSSVLGSGENGRWAPPATAARAASWLALPPPAPATVDYAGNGLFDLVIVQERIVDGSRVCHIGTLLTVRAHLPNSAPRQRRTCRHRRREQKHRPQYRQTCSERRSPWLGEARSA